MAGTAVLLLNGGLSLTRFGPHIYLSIVMGFTLQPCLGLRKRFIGTHSVGGDFVLGDYVE